MTTIGERIARYRRLNGWSAETLAQECGDAGISRDVIANIENDRRKDMGVSQLWAIARGLRVPMIALLVDLERPEGPTDDRTVLEVLRENQSWHAASQPPSARQAHAQLAALRTYDRLRVDLSSASEELAMVGPEGVAGAAETSLIVAAFEAARDALDDHVTVMKALGIRVRRDG